MEVRYHTDFQGVKRREGGEVMGCAFKILAQQIGEMHEPDCASSGFSVADC
ncbi:MAG: hypothetical protein OEV99_10760 [Nitrospira sp.]|nr:hypothetical protein [Nitrospira sp.]MDH4370316.1 hypothetical protein [Nitrospira sp.]MDH5497512.1 hypothetical protein [Nitrospira sp.]MDH5726454.1 hypothetical protein [Nitrospira sp.]